MTNEFKEITTVIIDDLDDLRCQLIDFLSDYGDIKIVAEANSAESGFNAILNHQPDLVILDISMEEDDSGIQLATQIREVSKQLLKPPCIVFMTAYSGHDYPSIVRNNPISFLKRPFSSDDVSFAIAAVRSVLENTDEEERLTNYMVIDGGTKYFINPINNILYIRSLDNSTYIFLEDGRELKTNIALGYYKEMFETIKICQVSKSFLVNLYKVDSIEGLRNTEKGSITRHKIVLKNHQSNITVGRTYYNLIVSKLEQLR